MDHLSSYTGQFRVEGTSSQNGGVRKRSIKRNRPRLSCVPCSNRKLKCDRRRPCETCVKRNENNNCIYDRDTRLSPDNGNGRRLEPNDRLSRIEELVREMMESETTSSPRIESPVLTQTQSNGATPESGAESGTEGHLVQDSSQIGYAGSTHWSAILENIQELKTTMHSLASTEPGESNSSNLPEGDILFGSSGHYSLQQILSESLPPRVQVDRRLSAFFRAQTLVTPYIHVGSFQRQYQKFWEDPLGTSPLWVSILFSLCCMAATISEATGSEPTNLGGQLNTRAGFTEAAARCLVLGEFSRPQRHVVEALGLYMQCKYMYGLDPSRSAWVVFGVVVRIAYMMGYHRDPDNLGNFTVFEGEMRRRSWSSIRQFDLMISFQFGLPGNIPIDTWDTKAPRNLLDSDFDEETKTLPPSRSRTELTPILYFIVKHNLLEVFSKVCNHALSFASKSQAEVLQLDTELRQMYSTVPEGLRMRPMSQSVADPSFLILTRLYIELLHQKCLCILHRRYMTQSFEYSTKACVDAAMAIITCMIDINKEFQPGGQLHADRWILSSFNMNDFLFAIMILCLSLYAWRRRNPERRVNDDPAAYSQFHLLEQSYTVCVEKSALSKESRRVAAAVSMILDQFEPEPSGRTTMFTRSSADVGHVNTFYSDSTALPRNNGMSSLSLEEPQSIVTVPNSATDECNTFEDIFDNLENVDWTYLAQSIVSPIDLNLDGGSNWANT